MTMKYLKSGAAAGGDGSAALPWSNASEVSGMSAGDTLTVDTTDEILYLDAVLAPGDGVDIVGVGNGAFETSYDILTHTQESESVTDCAELAAYKIITGAYVQYDALNYPNIWTTADTEANSWMYELVGFGQGGDNGPTLQMSKTTGTTIAATRAAINTTPGKFFTDGTTLYFSTFGNTNPNSDGKVYIRSQPAILSVGVYATANCEGIIVGGVGGIQPDGTSIQGAAIWHDPAHAGVTANFTGYLRRCYAWGGNNHTIRLNPSNALTDSNILWDRVRWDKTQDAGSNTDHVYFVPAGCSNIRHLVASCRGPFFSHGGLTSAAALQVRLDRCDLILDPKIEYRSVYSPDNAFTSFVITRSYVEGAVSVPCDLTVMGNRLGVNPPTNGATTTLRFWCNIITPVNTNGGFKTAVEGIVDSQWNVFDMRGSANGDNSGAWVRSGVVNFTSRNNIFISYGYSYRSIHGLVSAADTINSDYNYYVGKAVPIASVFCALIDGVDQNFAGMQGLGYETNGAVIANAAGFVDDQTFVNALLFTNYIPAAGSTALGKCESKVGADATLAMFLPRKYAGAFEPTADIYSAAILQNLPAALDVSTTAPAFGPNGTVGTLNIADTVAAQLVTDTAAVEAGKADILDTRTILGVTGTRATPQEPDGCIVSFSAVHAGAPLTSTVFRFRCMTAPSGNGNIFVNDSRETTSDANGLVTIELPQSSTWRGRAPSGYYFDVIVPAASTYVPPNVSV